MKKQLKFQKLSKNIAIIKISRNLYSDDLEPLYTNNWLSFYHRVYLMYQLLSQRSDRFEIKYLLKVGSDTYDETIFNSYPEFKQIMQDHNWFIVNKLRNEKRDAKIIGFVEILVSLIILVFNLVNNLNVVLFFEIFMSSSIFRFFSTYFTTRLEREL